MNERKSVLVRPEDVSPSSDEVEVVGVFNPGAVDADGVVHLLLRVAERPKEERPGWVALPAFGPAGRYEIEWVREQNVDRLGPRGVAFRRDGQHRLTTVSHLRLATSRWTIHRLDVPFANARANLPAARVEREHIGLLRQYFPKGADLAVHSQAHRNKVARQLNERPRETSQFEIQQRDLKPVLRRPIEPASLKGHARIERETSGCSIMYDGRMAAVAAKLKCQH